MRQYANKVDANQKRIVDVLRQVGASVQPLNAVGKGCPDLLVGYVSYNNASGNILLEVKTKTGKLTTDQVAWHNSWRGRVAIVHDVAEALEAIGFTKR